MPRSGEHDGSITAVLNQLLQTAGLEGVAVVDLTHTEAPVSYSAGLAGLETIAFGCALLASSPGGPVHGSTGDRRPVLACPWFLPPARPGGLLLWRAPRASPWGSRDHGLAASVAMLLLDAISTDMGQVGIDRLTGIPNRRWFLDEADRHIDRLDVDGLTGTLCLIDIDDLRRVNALAGREEGDRVLVRLANQLRSIVRPSDLVARVGADEFALWQNGMDHLTAAERADALCAQPLFNMANGQAVTFSVGIVNRRPGGAEDVRTLLRRAHMAARAVRAQGGGGWQVFRTEAARPRTDTSE